MIPQEKEAVATLCLMAAFADGQKGDAERQHIKAVVESLESVSAPALYQKVLLNQVTLEEAANALKRSETRHLAFEMAVGVCDADGVTNAAERVFLSRLGTALGLSEGERLEVEQAADHLAASSLEADLRDPLTPAEGAPDPVTAGQTAEADATILKYAVLAGALELLPQSLATMAVVPLQMKLVYDIGQRHGYALGKENVREFLAVAGVGMTSQVFEGYARKLFGSAAKKAFGKGGKKLAKGMTGPLMSFATTYGLGQVADTYYAGGRTLDQGGLKRTFNEQLERGKTLFAEYQGAVQAQSKTVNLRDVMGLIKP